MICLIAQIEKIKVDFGLIGHPQSGGGVGEINKPIYSILKSIIMNEIKNAIELGILQQNGRLPFHNLVRLISEFFTYLDNYTQRSRLCVVRDSKVLHCPPTEKFV